MLVAFPHPPGAGGPGSFQKRFEESLKKQGHQTTYKINHKDVDVIIIVGGSRRILKLIQAKIRGTPIIHRLDGISWLHRKNLRISTLNELVYGEINNLLVNLEQSFLADTTVYQSKFVQQWWRQSGFRFNQNSIVVHNGVCLDTFKPEPIFDRRLRLICIEGTLDYSPFAVDLINTLTDRLSNIIPFDVYGSFKNRTNHQRLNPSVSFHGRLKPSELPNAYQKSIYLSLDVNAACPNTVIEALASGCPVVGFDTGALAELVDDRSGKIVPYGGNPWNLDFPDVNGLVQAIKQVKENWQFYSDAARVTAVDRYDINNVSKMYLSAIESLLRQTAKRA